MNQTCGFAILFHIFISCQESFASTGIYKSNSNSKRWNEKNCKAKKKNQELTWARKRNRKKYRRIEKKPKPKPWHICLRDKWCRRCGRQTKYRRNLHKSTFQKYFGLYIFLYFSNCKRVKKNPHCICVLHTTRNKWNGKDKEDLKEGFPMFARITYCSRSTVGFSYSRYDHIHKLIKMFNQSYTQKKVCLLFLSWVQRLFLLSVFFCVRVDKALSSLF